MTVRPVWTSPGSSAAGQGSSPQASGFGTKLIERVVGYDLDGKANLSFEPGGLRAVLSFPLKVDAASPETSWSTLQPM